MAVIPGMLDPYPPRREIKSQGLACRGGLEWGSWQDLGFLRSIFWMKRPAGGPRAPGQGVSSAMMGTAPASVEQPVLCGSRFCPVWAEVLRACRARSPPAPLRASSSGCSSQLIPFRWPWYRSWSAMADVWMMHPCSAQARPCQEGY